MALILCIDTALSQGFAGIAQNGKMLALRQNGEPQQHASFLQPAIAELLGELNIDLKELAAIAVSNGPGSYTGLRVGLASAKGLCFALNLPLITLSTLEILALAMKHTLENEDAAAHFCPMIDARRMEVFTALYNAEVKEAKQAVAAILDENFMLNELSQHRIYFGGDGADKWMRICNHSNAALLQPSNVPAAMAALAQKAYDNRHVANLAYSEPFYCKAFYQALPIAKK